MEQGTLGELYLTRSVTKHIRKKSKNVVIGAAVGNDFSQISGTGDIVTAEAVAVTPYIAWVKAFNNIAVSGAKKLGARIVLLLPSGVSEKDIKEYMSCFNLLADEEQVQIIGGHSQILDVYSHASFCVTAFGELEKESLGQDESRAEKSCNPVRDVKQIQEGFDIVMAGYAGNLGARIIAEKRHDLLVEHFSKSYVEDFIAYKDALSVDRAACIMRDCNVCYMHDVSWGGLYGALWQLGVGIKKGIIVEHFKINIRQETVEFSEYFNINPYLLDGTGALLGVASDGEKVVLRLAENNIAAAVIGRVSQDRERVVVAGDEKRFLQPPKYDELYKVVDRV